MTEEDQGSYFDDREEQEPIKVSVTFKPREPDINDRQDNSELNRVCNIDKPCLRDPHKNEDDYNDSEAEEPSLPANPPVTPIPSYLDADNAKSEGSKNKQQEVLKGWKGYSNNIYIRPIIVNHASCGECQCLANQRKQRRLTNEDLRKQMRLREANNWIKKHNERIQSTGTLRSKPFSHELQRQQKAKQIQNKPKDDGNTKCKRKNEKVHKGFVCSTWASPFLSRDAQRSEDDEFIPLYVRKYVDELKSAPPGRIRRNTSLLQEHKTFSEAVVTPRDVHDPSSENSSRALSRIEVQLKEKLSHGESYNRSTSEKPNSPNMENISHALICSCGQIIHHDNDKRVLGEGFQTSKSIRAERVRNTKSKFTVVLPIKQFPPINPLEELKKPDFPARNSKKRGVSLNRRPHTVNTALLSRGVILVNGHHNLPNFIGANKAFNGQCSGQSTSKSSFENLCKEKQFCSRGRQRHGYEQDGGFDESIQLMPWGFSKTAKESGKSQCVLDKEPNDREKCGRHRSLSDLQRVPKSLDENSNNLYQNSTDCLKGQRRCVRTPLHSLNSEDDDSKPDSNETGLVGSEIEYSVDGLAKLDVYLQPRDVHFNEN